MNEEEKKAVEYLEKYTKWETYGERNLEKDIITTLNLIEKQQKEIEEKDKIINVMAEYISKKEILVDKHCYALTAEAIKQYFKKQVT